ncbi:TonB-dependent receptor [Sphingomonas sp. MG17]|uniref:TonB-dependent receptor n=1 Tax=Sphingomonas tagetis TaxID=2949092 RepID=A0A9X2HMZ1_9SPHN|nr:TonB-dependent receptor [Sphingomonas tagetis]MCP3732254.1 TonB-dependent receptor [Sphingomonas tagetis]
MARAASIPSLTAIALILAAASAHAQDRPGTAPPSGGQAPGTDAAGPADGTTDIIVTAQRRSESLLQVPASVGVLTGAQLEAAKITSLASVQDLSPSLLVTQSSNPSAGVFTVRGIGTAVTDRGFEQSVGVYIDGVFRGRPGAALQDLLDIERVEILRGPQSTLFGRNNAAGAINISTALPDLNELRVGAEATYGNYDTVQARLSASIPIVSDTLALRVSAAENYRDGFIKAPNLPRGNVNGRDRQSFRAQLYWTPGDTTRIRLIGDYSQINDRCCAYQQLFVADEAATPPFQFNVRGGLLGSTPPTPGTRGTSPSSAAITGTFYRPFDRVTTQDNRSVEKATDKGVSAQIDQDAGALTFTLIGATRRFESNIDLDVDGSNSAVVNLQSKPSTDIKENSVELRVQNRPGGAIEFIAGAYYFDQVIEDRNLLLATIKPIATTITFFNSIGRGKTRSGAAFGQMTANITDQLRVTGGLRYLKESKDTVVTVAPGTFSFAGSDSRDDDALMGTGIVAYQPSSNVNLYLRYARGFKSGGTNLLLTLPTTIASPSVEPETTDAYEAGLKLRALDGRLSTNLAVYSQTVRDQQVQSFNTATASFVTLNAAKVRSRGFEADVTFRPVRPITFTGNVSYLDAEYLSFPGAPAPAGGTGTQNLTGRTPANAPRWTLVAGIGLDQPLNDGVRLIGNVNLRHATGYYTDVQLSEAFRNPTTNVLNASVELALSSGLGLQVWGRNLTKENYYLTGIGTAGGNGSLSVFVNEPRVYGLTLRYRH